MATVATSVALRRLGQTSTVRTVKAVDMFKMSSSRVAAAMVMPRRDVTSIPAALPGLLSTPVTSRKVDMGHGRHALVACGKMSTVPVPYHNTIQDALKNIDLVVYDMAGTTVEEGGLVYQTLRRVIVEDGMDVSEEAICPWHGAKKEAVIEHFARQDSTPEGEIAGRVQRISASFENAINDAYFGSDSKVALIHHDLMSYFGQLKAAGIKIGLDTGYPADIQRGLVRKLGLDNMVDSYISSYDVPEGRPYPYMIHHLMERCGVMSSSRVAKMGDSVRDIEEGRNAGCGLVVGVLSGADTADALLAAGADIIVPMVMDLPAPLAM